MNKDGFETLKIPNARLFQYTSESGFRGIVSRKAIWATEIRNLNDSKEFHYCIELTRKQLVKFDDSVSSQESKFLGRVEMELDELQADSYGLYVASFSADGGDKLCQWRSYGDDGKGISVGFDFMQPEICQRLNSSAAADGLWFAKCIYNPKKQKELIQSALRNALDDFRAKNDQGVPRAELFALAVFQRNLYKLATMLKHPAFAQEREWRLVIKVPLVMDELEQSYRRTRQMYSPPITETMKFDNGIPTVQRPDYQPPCEVLKEAKNFVPYRLVEESSELNLDKIIIGPAHQEDRTYRRSIRALLSEHRITCPSVRQSRIPYRSV